ncbi:site-specific DNA-methyltransferase [Labilibaculum sp. A4]|uniref:site-specific DNA-methyltransferase n=1 Tax=Labilibaculum euxinus TaxID=2686357 RepID=UPI000F6252A1|nr:site-specific DNA-methyltransferase [Labilibaculum euxinus]MDQ1769202.1 site-specific DNA-methyltransferase [Labilibaculum euxinus]MWN74726.1 site-specific DNA-methyltransferase [Labilibaculum euxinus]
MQGKNLLSFYQKQKKIKELKSLLPEVFAGDQLDIQKLKIYLETNQFVDESNYGLTWFGKENAAMQAREESTDKLVFDKAKSVQPKTTQNLFVEGDNLDALRLLQKDYSGKIKLIYIDPPYNTGNDFGYNDRFKIRSNQYLEFLDGTGIERVDFGLKNQIESGEVHTNWLNMIYPRLILSRQLLTNDGAIAVSIDESEKANVQLICNEVFGEDNFIGCFIWINRTNSNVSGNLFAANHEYILLYAKNTKEVKLKGELKDLSNYSNPDNDPNGDWIPDNPSAASGNSNSRFVIANPFTKEEYLPPSGRYWAFSKLRVAEWFDSGKLIFPKEEGKRFLLKKYKSELKSIFNPISSVITDIPTSKGTRELKELYPEGLPFKYPKPTDLLLVILEQLSDDGDLILDLFAGSASMPHAVFKLNEKQASKRRFICVQNTELVKEDSDAGRMGFSTISDLARDRIVRAGKLYPKLDTGFRFYRIEK